MSGEPRTHRRTIRSTHAALCDRSEHPERVLEQCLATIECDNPTLHAVAHTQAESARDAAKRSAERYRAGRPLSTLDGIPVIVKAMIATAGWPLDAVSEVLSGVSASADATVVASLRAAGAVLVGAATQDEFALTTLGPARTPHDPDRTAGGSSGGSAASVCAGMAYGALGTDTGGSIRIPAAFCGVVGLKPTYGALSTHGVIELASSLDHIGPIGRTVDDVRILLEELVAGQSGRDVATKCVASTRATGGAIRLGVPGDEWLSVLDDSLRDAFHRSLSAMGDDGIELVQVELPDQEHVKQVHWTVLSSELSHYHRRTYGDGERRYGPAMAKAIAAGAQVSADAYADALNARRAVRHRIDALLTGIDALVLPTTAIAPPLAGRCTVPLDGNDNEDATAAMVRLTSLANHTGHPAISVPAGEVEGLPTGVQVIGHTARDGDLLVVAEALERSVGAD